MDPKKDDITFQQIDLDFYTGTLENHLVSIVIASHSVNTHIYHNS